MNSNMIKTLVDKTVKRIFNNDGENMGIYCILGVQGTYPKLFKYYYSNNNFVKLSTAKKNALIYLLDTEFEMPT